MNLSTIKNKEWPTRSPLKGIEVANIKIKYTKGWLLDHQRRYRHGKCRFCNYYKFETKNRKKKNYRREFLRELRYC
jgi:hypothetical protein